MDIGNILKEIHFANLLWLLLIPVAMMAIDIVTGLLNAWNHSCQQKCEPVWPRSVARSLSY